MLWSLRGLYVQRYKVSAELFFLGRSTKRQGFGSHEDEAYGWLYFRGVYQENITEKAA